MGYRTRIKYTAAQKADIWDRWQHGESLNSIGRLFDRHSAACCEQAPVTLVTRTNRRLAKADLPGAREPSGVTRNHLQEPVYTGTLCAEKGAAATPEKPACDSPFKKQSRNDRKKVEMLFAHLKHILKLDRLRLHRTCEDWKLLGQPPPIPGVTAPA